MTQNTESRPWTCYLLAIYTQTHTDFFSKFQEKIYLKNYENIRPYYSIGERLRHWSFYWTFFTEKLIFSRIQIRLYLNLIQVWSSRGKFIIYNTNTSIIRTMKLKIKPPSSLDHGGSHSLSYQLMEMHCILSMTFWHLFMMTQ